MRPRNRLLLPFAFCAQVAACSVPSPRLEEANPLLAPPVDSTRVRSADEAAAWGPAQSLEADLNGDGAKERLVLSADVARDESGVPLWEDGHRWAVWVEDRGQKTILYAAFVPNGKAEAAVLIEQDSGIRHVLIEERTPQQLKVFVVAYEGPGAAKSVSASYDQVGQWLPSLDAVR